EPARIDTPEPAVFRIAAAGQFGSRAAGRLPIGRRGDEESMQRLEAPAAADELVSQPVEQFGMAGGITEPAQVAGRGDEAAAKMLLPDAVDDHPRREGMIGLR